MLGQYMTLVYCFQTAVSNITRKTWLSNLNSKQVKKNVGNISYKLTLQHINKILVTGVQSASYFSASDEKKLRPSCSLSTA